MNDYPDEVRESADGQQAVFGRLFALAVERAGSPAALARSLRLTPTELERYAAGDAMPPNDVILRTVDWIIDYYVAQEAVRSLPFLPSN